MPITAIVGYQTGDEGKGHVVDIEAEFVAWCIRYQGGANAGHTVVLIDGTTFKLNLTPSGVAHKDVLLGYAAGMVAEPRKLLTEWKMLESMGYSVLDRAIIDEGMIITTPMNRILDFADEFYRVETLGKEKVGTTGRGITQSYADEINKSKIPFGMFLGNKDRFAAEIRQQCNEKERFIKYVKLIDNGAFSDFFEQITSTEKKANKSLIENGIISLDDIDYVRFHDAHNNSFNPTQIIDSLWETGQNFKDNIDDLSLIIHKELLKGKDFLFEGAQGRVIDKRWGYTPNVTTSHTIASEASAGSGVAMNHIERIIGVLKAYSTKVGNHVFVTKIDPEEYSDISIKLKKLEFGTTTGRQREVGWEDLPELRRSHIINGANEIALIKLDALAGFDELLICDYYVDKEGKKYDVAPRTNEQLREMKPHYIKMKGFGDITGCTDWNKLPLEAKQYAAVIAKAIQETNPSIDLKMSYIGTGPKRDQVITNAPSVKDMIKEYCA